MTTYKDMTDSELEDMMCGCFLCRAGRRGVEPTEEQRLAAYGETIKRRVAQLDMKPYELWTALEWYASKSQSQSNVNAPEAPTSINSRAAVWTASGSAEYERFARSRGFTSMSQEGLDEVRKMWASRVTTPTQALYDRDVATFEACRETINKDEDMTTVEREIALLRLREAQILWENS